MWLFVGLGNPGENYRLTRHNIGFMAVDEIIRRHSFSAGRTKFKGELTEGTIGKERVLVLKPLTYMNLSGQSVQEAVAFYKIPLAQIVVFHDELDVPFGKVKAKCGGGHGGHNGLRSIDSHLGKEYIRIRLGIGHPGDRSEVSNYVLGNFSKQEQAELPFLLGDVAELSDILLTSGPEVFLTRLALRRNPPKIKPLPAAKPVVSE